MKTTGLSTRFWTSNDRLLQTTADQKSLSSYEASDLKLVRRPIPGHCSQVGYAHVYFLDLRLRIYGRLLVYFLDLVESNLFT